MEAFWIVCSQLFGAMLALFGVYLVQGRDDRYLGEPFPSALVTHDAYIILYEAAAAFLFWSLVNCYSAPRRASISALEQTISMKCRRSMQAKGQAVQAPLTRCKGHCTHSALPPQRFLCAVLPQRQPV